MLIPVPFWPKNRLETRKRFAVTSKDLKQVFAVVDQECQVSGIVKAEPWSPMQVFLALTVIITYQSFFFVLFSNVDISSAISVTREGEAFFWAFCCHSSCRCCCPPLKGQRGVKIPKEMLRRWRIPIFYIVGGCCHISIWYFPFYHISHSPLLLLCSFLSYCI